MFCLIGALPNHGGFEMIVYSRYLNNLLLSQISGHAASGGYNGAIYNGTLFLFDQQVLILPSFTLANFTEAKYSGYARQTGLTWGVPILQPDGSYTILSALATFLAVGASPFNADNVWGWGLLDTSASPNLLMSEVFSAPVAFSVPGDGFGLVIEMNYGPPNPASFGSVLA